MKHTSTNLRIAGLCSIVFALTLLTSCAPKNGGQTATDSTSVTTTSSGGSGRSADRGKYLVTSVAGCGDCHTPWKMGDHGPEPDMSKMLSGHPAAVKIPGPMPMPMPWMGSIDMTFTAFGGPWGVSFTANLTPDSLTGLGSWSQETFMNALKTGKHMGTGRPILPPMPWPVFKNMTDDDLASIYMYLRTIPAVSNQVPDPIPPMPGMPGMPGMGGPPGGMPPGAPPPHAHPMPKK